MSYYPRVRVNVKVLALLIRAFPVLGEEVALWHFSHVILMQVLTTVTLEEKGVRGKRRKGGSKIVREGNVRGGNVKIAF